MKRKQRGSADGEAIAYVFGLIIFCSIVYSVVEGIRYIFAHYLGVIYMTLAIIISVILYAWLALYLNGLYKKGRIKNKTALSIITLVALVGIIASLFFGKNCYDNTFAQQSVRMSDMKGKLEKQVRAINEAQDKYYYKIADLKSEIRSEKQKTGIRNLSSATVRMQNNLQLIQEQEAYWHKLAEIKIATENGLEEVIFMQRKLEARKTMSDVVSGGRGLGNEINTLLRKYTPYVNQIAINPQELVFASPKEIWESL